MLIRNIEIDIINMNKVILIYFMFLDIEIILLVNFWLFLMDFILGIFFIEFIICCDILGFFSFIIYELGNGLFEEL